MSCSCRSSINYRTGSHVRVPVRANYVSLYKRPESDAEFMRSVAKGRSDGTARDDSMRNAGRGSTPAFMDVYSCRQTYLKSYTFSRKESRKERARRCVVKARDRMSSFAFLCKKKIVGGRRSERRTRKKKNCFVVVGELRRACRATVGAVFRRVVSCGAAINAGDRHCG